MNEHSVCIAAIRPLRSSGAGGGNASPRAQLPCETCSAWSLAGPRGRLHGMWLATLAYASPALAKPGIADVADSAAYGVLMAAGLLCLAMAVLVVFAAVSIEAGRWTAARWSDAVWLGTGSAVVVGMLCMTIAFDLLVLVAPVYFGGLLLLPTVAVGAVKVPQVRKALWAVWVAVLILAAWWLLGHGLRVAEHALNVE